MFTFAGLVSAATASGTWRLVWIDAAGATLCDSGPVAWQAAAAR